MEQDPRLVFLESLNIQGTRIEHRPPKLFFCGGPVENLSNPIISVRDHVIRHIWDNDSKVGESIVLAEDIQDWLHYATYDDLITFEQHLAHLASAIVLFVESPGSIAELGAFSLTNEIASKLLVFVREDQYENDSYIRLGPIKHIEKKYGGDRVFVYPWKTIPSVTGNDCESRLVTASSAKLVSDIFSDIEEFLKGIPKTEKFDKTNDGHLMLIISDLVDLFLILKESEIKDYLEKLGLDIHSSELNQYLFICEKLQLIKRQSYSGGRYFVRTSSTTLVKYSTEKDHRLLDRVKVKSRIQSFYETSDTKRFRALRKSRESA